MGGAKPDRDHYQDWGGGMKASVGLIALWTGQIKANMEHVEGMAIHQMNDVQLEQFEKYIREIGYSIAAITRHITQVQESE
jgi:hypothetical protein